MDRVAIVTGGTRGIGLAIVKGLLEEGFSVACMGRTLNETVSQVLEAWGEKLIFIEVDINHIDSIHTAVTRTVDHFGRIDLLVNNAGIAPKERKDVLETTPESFDLVIQANLRGTYFMSQAVANQMVKQENIDRIPKIINISSISAYASSTNRGEYCISKAGIGMVTKLFADRLAEEGIFVYEVRPSIIKTDMTAKVSEKYDKLIEEGLFPIKRWGYPEDIANVVCLLSSPKMCYSTGDIINVDGGFHLRRL